MTPVRKTLNVSMDILALNHVGVRCTNFKAMEAAYIGVLGEHKLHRQIVLLQIPGTAQAVQSHLALVHAFLIT